MVDDIVTRLREVAVQEYKDGWAVFPVCDQAADEIERLREWKELAYQMRNKYWWVMSKKILKQFDAMHKADWALPRNVAWRKQLEQDWQSDGNP